MTAGSRMRGRTRAVSEVFMVNYLRGVSVCMCSKKDGPSASHRPHINLPPLCTRLTCCRWLVVTSVCFFVCDNVLCNCGHRELHRIPAPPPRWWICSTLRSMPLIRWLSKSRRVEGLPIIRAQPSATRNMSSRVKRCGAMIAKAVSVDFTKRDAKTT